MVESYPHDLTDADEEDVVVVPLQRHPRLYERLGFTYVRPKGLKNCVMSIEVPAR